MDRQERCDPYVSLPMQVTQTFQTKMSEYFYDLLTFSTDQSFTFRQEIFIPGVPFALGVGGLTFDVFKR